MYWNVSSAGWNRTKRVSTMINIYDAIGMALFVIVLTIDVKADALVDTETYVPPAEQTDWGCN